MNNISSSATHRWPAPAAIARLCPPGTSFVFLAILLLRCPAVMDAQPTASVTRITYNAPYVELSCRVNCGDSVVPLTKEQLRILDVGPDSTDITEFDLLSPEPGMRSPVTAVLVLDHSGSMSGAGILGLTAAAHAFVDRLDPATDLCGIVWFSTMPRIGQRLTADKDRLHAAIDDVPNMAMTGCWDAACVGITELARSDPERSRTLILMTDGGDGSSSRQPSEIIAMAQLEHIRICTIGLGSGINATELEMIAQRTGGIFRQTPQASMLPSVYDEFFDRATRRFDACEIRYVAPEDYAISQLRSVRLLMSDVCGDSTTVTQSYRVPLPTKIPVHFALEDAPVDRYGIARVSLRTSLPFPGDSLPPFTMDIDTYFAREHLRCIGIENSGAAMLRPGPGVSVDFPPHGMRLSTSRAFAPVTDTIAVLLFDVFAWNAGERYDIVPNYPYLSSPTLQAVHSGAAIRGDRPVGVRPAADVASSFDVLEIHPNPVRDNALVRIACAVRTRPRVSVRDLLGRVVAVQDFGDYDPGIHVLGLDCSRLRPGSYLLLLETPAHTHCRLLHVID